MPLQRTESSASLSSLTSLTPSTSSGSTTNKLRRHTTARKSSRQLSPLSASTQLPPKLLAPPPPTRRHTSPSPRSPISISQNDADWLAGMMELLDDLETSPPPTKECRLKTNGSGSTTWSGMGLKWFLDRWFW